MKGKEYKHGGNGNFRLSDYAEEDRKGIHRVILDFSRTDGENDFKDSKGNWKSLKDLTHEAKERLEKEVIYQALEENNWNRKRTAEILDISYKAILYKIEQYRLEEMNNPPYSNPPHVHPVRPASAALSMDERKNGSD